MTTKTTRPFEKLFPRATEAQLHRLRQIERDSTEGELTFRELDDHYIEVTEETTTFGSVVAVLDVDGQYADQRHKATVNQRWNKFVFETLTGPTAAGVDGVGGAAGSVDRQGHQPCGPGPAPQADER